MPSGDETERKRELWGEEGEVEERAVRRKEVHCGGMVGCYLSTDFLLGVDGEGIQSSKSPMLAWL